MKSIRTLILGAVAFALTAFPAFASRTPEARLDKIEAAQLTATINTSSTIFNAQNYYFVAPFSGFVTGLRCVYEGTANAQGASPTGLIAKVGGVSLTTVSASVVSGTAPGTVVSASTPVSQTNAVSKSSVVEVKPTGGLTTGGPLRCYLEITPNYQK